LAFTGLPAGLGNCLSGVNIILIVCHTCPCLHACSSVFRPTIHTHTHTRTHTQTHVYPTAPAHVCPLPAGLLERLPPNNTHTHTHNSVHTTHSVHSVHTTHSVHSIHTKHSVHSVHSKHSVHYVHTTHSVHSVRQSQLLIRNEMHTHTHAYLTAPARVCRPARASATQDPGASASVRRSRRARDAHGVAIRVGLGQNLRDAARPHARRLPLYAQTQVQLERRRRNHQRGVRLRSDCSFSGAPPQESPARDEAWEVVDFHLMPKHKSNSSAAAGITSEGWGCGATLQF